jgi:signal transduction histidine kinase
VRHLYLQIYLAVLGILLLFGALLATLWWLLPDEGGDQRTLQGLTQLFAEALPPERAGEDALAQTVRRLATAFDADVNVRAADGRLLAVAGDVLAPVPAEVRTSTWQLGRGPGPKVALRLADGRWVVARLNRPHRHFGVPVALVLLLAAIAAGSYPVVRRITRRLERLRARVEALGAGDLKARVELEGRDEVAALARSFNGAAQRIEQLVGGYRTLLANVSHELRTPLARMRMALELLPSQTRPELREQVAVDIGELDALIGELLLASRLDTIDAPPPAEEVDLLALVAEEAAATGAQLEGVAASVPGDARLLRRLVRNLLQNAARHAPGAPVSVRLEQLPDGKVRLAVCDRGPGIPEAERERVFEPFYRVPGTRADGSGLGLSLVRQIARHHRGSVRCSAHAGGGTCFELDLPGPRVAS